MKGITSFRKLFVLSIAAAAPVMGLGCGNNTCTQVRSTSLCGSAPSYRAVRTVAVAPAPVAVTSAPVTVAAPVSYGAPVVYAGAGTGAVVAESYSGVKYKHLPDRSITAAMANIDGGSLGVVRTSSAGSAVLNSVVTSADVTGSIPIASSVSYPTASYPAASYPTASYPVVAATAGIPAGGYVVSEAPAAVYSTPVDAGVRQYRQPRRGAARRGAPAPAAVYSNTGIPSGTPVYVTPGGTPVSAYVPAPASGTYMGGAAPTGYLPVTERRGPDNAVIHYATRSICEYDPARGEDCVWTSGF